MPERFFITGTDTGIGKTVVAALLCAALDAYYWKPIQTGTREGSDSRTVARIAERPRAKILPEAFRFAPPVSPHLAAQKARVRIDIDAMRLPEIGVKENLIVEGAGGALVPINETQLTTDLMKRLGLPILLVARTTLGTINHTLLSLAALRAARLRVSGVVLDGKPHPQNRQAIEHYGRTKVVGIVPPLGKLDRATLLEAFHKSFDPRVFHS
jgi:dethiobiotin synthetase